MAYNTITGIARAVSTSFPIRMRLTGGAVWADGILQNDGTYLCTLVAVPAGSYPAGAVEYELKGSNPVVRAYNTNATIVTNDPSAGGGTPATKANKPQFGVLDDVGNTVIITSEYAYDQIYWGIDGQGTPAQQLASNYTCSPGNITGRLYAYVMGNAAANRLQSDYSYSSSFSAAANANTNPIATLSVVGGVSSVTTGQSIVLQLDGVDSDQGDSVVKMEALDNGVKIGEITGASGALQTPPLGAGSHSFTARAVDSKGAAGLSPAKLVTATSSGSVWDNKPLLYNAGGDSKADGTYVAKIATALGAAPTYTNGAHFETTNYQCWWTARGGNIIEEQINNFASMAAPLLTGTFTGGVYSIECGVNNLLRRTGQSAAQLADQLKTLVGMARDAGYKVIIETLTRTTWGDQNGSDPNANGTGVLGTPLQPRINALNTLIRSNWASWGASRLVDLDAIPALDPVAHPDCFNDGLHPSDLGQQYEGKAVYDAIISLNNEFFHVPVPAYTWSIAPPAAGSVSIPGKVTGIAVTPQDQGLHLVWPAAASNGGAITDYVVQIRDASSSGNVFKSVAHNATPNTNITITGLNNAGSYELRLAGLNSAGQGPWSDVVTGSPRLVSSTAAITETSDLLTYLPLRGYYTFDGVGDGRAYVAPGNYGIVQFGYTGSQVRLVFPTYPQATKNMVVKVNGEIVKSGIDLSLGANGETTSYTLNLTPGSNVIRIERADVNDGYWMFHLADPTDGGFYPVN